MNNWDKLTKEYQDWCKQKGYPELSADELICQTTGDDDANEEVYVVHDQEDRIWLNDFINRWEKEVQ